MLWSEVEQSNKEEMFRTQWGHLGTRMKGHKSYVVWYTPDEQEIWYGPYRDPQVARRVMNEIADENVNYKYPFLSEPIQEVSIDGAANLISLMITQTRTSYIARARVLKRSGKRIPTSLKEYKEFETDDSALFNDIRFMENGSFGGLQLLTSDITGEEILREWKKEALGYR